MTTAQIKSISEVLDLAGWMRLEDNNCVFEVVDYAKQLDNRATYRYTSVELDAFHPQSTELLHFLWGKNIYRSHHEQCFNVFKKTIEHWTRPGTPIRDTSNGYIDRIDGISPWENNTYMLDAIVYQVFNSDLGRPVASETYYGSVVVDADWLNTHFPGSPLRIAAAFCLELSAEETARHALAPNALERTMVLPVDVSL